ncbi:hypothetical protein BCR43DRAFT_490586 [Syncephalastrum racemosum]|uniref:Uncharacterized protein n=1 Tax=Syncephalastrum racemosum TaxID=13706 RepID=A0A1X2HG88_SYNRA|nr:hypothetical protein BCR43DRAFT_490586 [Syncephalastrum racemosum]
MPCSSLLLYVLSYSPALPFRKEGLFQRKLKKIDDMSLAHLCQQKLLIVHFVC